jgi:hypothetical protein
MFVFALATSSSATQIACEYYMCVRGCANLARASMCLGVRAEFVCSVQCYIEVSGYTLTFGVCVYVSLTLSLSLGVCVCAIGVRMCECEGRCGRQRGGTCARLCRVACVSHSICGRVLGAGDRRKADVPV